MNRAPVSQRGAALLIALLAVALAAVMATALVERGQRDVARTAAVFNGERAWQYAEGMEALARDWIGRRNEAGIPGNLLDGQWSEPFPVPGGSVRGRVLDFGGRFNLNALAHPDPAAASRARQTLSALLSSLGMPPESSERAASLYRPGPDGVTVPLAHASELARLPGFDRETLARLEPYLVVLPDPGSRININRAEPEVLAAAIDGLSLEAARALAARGPFETLDGALAQPELSAVRTASVRDRLAVDSAWFLVHAQVVLDADVRDSFRLVGVAGSRYDARYVSHGIF
ncbi:MAG: type II secretion system minor pseudopilin GspK [Candidatus Wenzhouxiangella sp. M2_3B_020]